MRSISVMAALGAALLLASCGPPPDPPTDCAAAGELQPGCFELQLTSTPAAAAATLDGIAVGETPLTVRGHSGVLTLEVVLAGHEPYLTDLDLDGIESHQATLVPIAAEMGTLDVSADVAGGMLLVDDEPVGVMETMPMAVMVLEGSHRVTVMLAGYVATTQTAEVRARETTSVDIAVGRDLTGSWECMSDIGGMTTAEVAMDATAMTNLVYADGFQSFSLVVSGDSLASSDARVIVTGTVSSDGQSLAYDVDAAMDFHKECSRL